MRSPMSRRLGFWGEEWLQGGVDVLVGVDGQLPVDVLLEDIDLLEEGAQYRGVAGGDGGLGGAVGASDPGPRASARDWRSALSTVHTSRATTRPRRPHAGHRTWQASRAVAWRNPGCISALSESPDTRKVVQ